MAFGRMIPQRLMGMSGMANPNVTNSRTSSLRMAVKFGSLNHQTASNKLAHDLGDNGIFRRCLHRQSAVNRIALRFLPTGEKLLEKLREMDTSRDVIKLDNLKPAATAVEESPDKKLTLADAKKILKFSQLEMVKLKLKQIEKDFVCYPEFLEICCKECSSPDQGLEFAKSLDESGSVIALGNIVFLRPEQEIETNVSHPDL